MPVVNAEFLGWLGGFYSSCNHAIKSVTVYAIIPDQLAVVAEGVEESGGGFSELVVGQSSVNSSQYYV